MGAKKGAMALVERSIGKGSKLMAIADGHGLPIALWITSASPHEQKLVENTIEHRFVADKPKRLIGDKGYDSDALDDRLAGHGIELIAPHRRYRTRTHRQDRRKTPALSTLMENRKVLRMVEELPASAGALGT
jgi:hypothetical protein